MTTERLLGIDASHWNADPKTYESGVDFKSLNEEGNVQFGIFKADKAALGHTVGARDSRMVTGLYHWHDPIQSVQWNLDQIEEYDRRINPDLWAMDIEQWWASWPLWWQAVYKKIGWDQVPRISPDKINSHAYKVVMGAKEITNKFTLSYSALWFIKQYAPKLAEWLKDEPLWLADYSKFGNTTRRLTWEQMLALPEVYSTGAYYKPAGVKMELVHQFTDRIIAPCQANKLDFNIFFGSRDYLDELVEKKAIPQPPQPVDEPIYKARVTAYRALNVRSAPTIPSRILGTLPKGHIVEVWEEQGSWARISELEQRWVHRSYLAKVVDAPVITAPLYAGIITNCYILNVRSGPGLSNKVVATIARNKPIEIWAEVGKWGKIDEAENRWVHLGYVKKI